MDRKRSAVFVATTVAGAIGFKLLASGATGPNEPIEHIERHVVPAVYDLREMEVEETVTPARTEWRTVPAKFEDRTYVEQQTIWRTEVRVKPAQYVDELFWREEITPARYERLTIPAVYATTTERVVVRQPGWQLVRRADAFGRPLLAREWCPEDVRYVSFRRLVTPQREEVTYVPGTSRWVEDHRMREISPKLYETVKVATGTREVIATRRELVEAARHVLVAVPTVTRIVKRKRKVLVSPERVELVRAGG